MTATELNRSPGRILEKALKHCVTIMRNDQAFALLRREAATDLVATAEHASVVVELLQAICRLTWGSKPNFDHAYEWLIVFDREELQQFMTEALNAFYRARRGESTWEELDAVLHEWKESAWAARSPVLAEALRGDDEEVPLTVPPMSSATAE